MPRSITNFLTFLLLALFSITITSCSDDDYYNDSDYTVGGTVSNLRGILTLANNLNDEITLNSSGVFEGPFTFALPVSAGTKYEVTISRQPTDQVCTVQNGTGVAYGNITNILVSCGPFGISRVSVHSDGSQGDNYVMSLSMSAEGRYVAFNSLSSTLVDSDTNNTIDVFVHDAIAKTTARISVDSSGTEGNGASYWPSISADGRFVAFHSFATNLVPGDTNGVRDIFVHDRQTGTTSRVSVDSAGAQGNAESTFTAISADGRYVAFKSDASNLVASDTNGRADVFVHDRQTGATLLASRHTDGSLGNSDSYLPSLSGDGRYVAFQSFASNLVTGDTNGQEDSFVHDTLTGTTIRISVDSNGVQGNQPSAFSSMSADGTHVAFASASALVTEDTNSRYDAYVHNLLTGTTTRASLDSSGFQGDMNSYAPTLSADGRFVAFFADATNLVPFDTNNVRDIFIHDRQLGTTRRVSGSLGEGNDDSVYPVISADGKYVAFLSHATNLVSGDTNGFEDIFLALVNP